jgi:hypothetical protein
MEVCGERGAREDDWVELKGRRGGDKGDCREVSVPDGI